MIYQNNNKAADNGVVYRYHIASFASVKTSVLPEFCLCNTLISPFYGHLCSKYLSTTFLLRATLDRV